jgi:hypothetical protein
MDLHYFIPITWDEAQDSENLKNAIENAFDRSENEDKYVIVKDI